jgi:UDP-glucuronate 4-epimerase
VNLVVEGIPGSDEAAADPASHGNAMDSASSSAPFRILNIGNDASIPLVEYIAAIKRAAGRSAALEQKPLHPGDIPDSVADVS